MIVRANCIFAMLLLAPLYALAAGAIGTDDTATCEAEFDATWSDATHPLQFPSGAHFSALVGGTHSSAASFWNGGALASPGIKDVAELGRTTPFEGEIEAAVTAGSADQVILAGAVAQSPGAVLFTFSANRRFPLLTLVTMIAPSPDWFVGVTGLPLFDNDRWQRQTVELAPWDAGTDSGNDYQAANAPTNPPEAITLITNGALGNGTPVGSLTVNCQGDAIHRGDFEAIAISAH